MYNSKAVSRSSAALPDSSRQWPSGIFATFDRAHSKPSGRREPVKIIPNAGSDRVLDAIKTSLRPGHQVGMVSQNLSLFAFRELAGALAALARVRLLLPSDDERLELFGTEADRVARNQLETRSLARRCADWIERLVEVRRTDQEIPQGAVVIQDHENNPQKGVQGATSFTTHGLGLAPGSPLSLIHVTETADEGRSLSDWFDQRWHALPADGAAKSELLNFLRSYAAHRDPLSVYALILQSLFHVREGDLDEEAVVKSATGIRNTQVWKKLFKFQRDGVVGAIDKLNRHGGCIIADSVGLGKTFEALAIIKYHELRNDRVLVLCPRRLRENWSLYLVNDRRNFLAADRFNYDILNHTDLSRKGGKSGEIDLRHVNWGNYDLVVIDESHNFRNKLTPRQGGETRYDRLMRRIIREGVKTRVLMLSATPVNNRLADLKNQIAFITEGDDAALKSQGIASIDSTTRQAQRQFRKWLSLDDARRTPSQLIEMLGFDYFSLLDRLTIARSRRHLEKYYGVADTGRFPERLKPINVKTDIDLAGEFYPINEVNSVIRRLSLAAYAPFRYLLPQKREAYDKKYSTRLKTGDGSFLHSDREESLVHMLRINALKRMESSVAAFALTLGRQLKDVEETLARIEAQAGELSGIEISDVDIDDPAYESLLVGRKVKVLIQDVDRIRWRQDLTEDRNRLQQLLSAARSVDAERDAKLAALREMIAEKVRDPINPGNRKLVIFTAFADTAKYLFAKVAAWAKQELSIESALVTGAGANQSTLPCLARDLGSLLASFAPRAKQRPEDLAGEGEVDLLFATDCISEGQNLQDCDWLVNYDIHWNPVRIIQRFGRIDRIGSPNQRIQLVNFWPKMELEEYLRLERRVSGRMVLLDVSATGEENLIQQQSGDLMNDLEYRRKQLLKLQDSVIDLEDLSSGVSITDLTLTDFRIDLAEYLRSHPDGLARLPRGPYAVTTATDTGTPPGIVFCLEARTEAAKRTIEVSYPLAPYCLVHVGDDGTIVLPFTHAKQVLDRLRRLCIGNHHPDQDACARFDRATRQDEDMSAVRHLLARAVASVVGKSEERAVESLFHPGGTHTLQGEFAGTQDFEVVAFLVILSSYGD